MVSVTGRGEAYRAPAAGPREARAMAPIITPGGIRIVETFVGTSISASLSSGSRIAGEPKSPTFSATM